MKKNQFVRQTQVACFTLILGLVGQSCSEGDGKATKQNAPGGGQPTALSVEGMIVQTDKVEDKIYATGTLLPNEEVELRPETSGRIVGIYFEEGSPVKAGKLLAEIDDSELESQLKTLKVQEKLARTEESRQKQLLGINAVSQEAYDVALNELNTVEARMDQLLTQIRKTNIYAPFAGVIGLRNISKGGYVSPASLIASMQQIDPIKLEFSVPEQYIGQVKEGASVNFSVTGSDEVYTAKVYAVNSTIDINTRTVKVRARSNNPDNKLKPGAFAKVDVVLKTFDDAIMIPTEIILTELEGQRVFVSKDGKAKSQPVKTGIRTEHAVQIVEGLAPKDTVVMTGLMSIQEGVTLDFKQIKKPLSEVNIKQPNTTL